MLVWTGSMVGALFGLAHAIYVFKVVAYSAHEGNSPNYLRAIYFSVWTFGLWVLFGVYVLVLWVAGTLFFIVFKAFR